VLAVGAAHTSATHYAATGATGATGGCDTSGPMGSLGCFLFWPAGLASALSPPPETIPTCAEYVAPTAAASARLVFHTWAGAGLTLGLRVSLMGLGDHPIPADTVGANVLGTMGVAFGGG
jgi:hypothetical protein